MRIIRSLEEVRGLTGPSAVAIGIFDGIHKGHQKVINAALDQAKAHNAVSVVLTFRMLGDSIPMGKSIDFKLMSEELFFRRLSDMGVDIVLSVSFDEIRELTPQQFVKNILGDKLGAKYITCGKDFKFGKNASGNVTILTSFAKEIGAEVKALPLVLYKGSPISSTLIRDAIIAGDMPTANDMLGHRYAVDFKIVAGNRIGRAMGAPTINQPYPDSYAVPLHGVYATLTFVDGIWHTSVTNVGVKPTISNDNSPLAETFIQNYEGNLYGAKILVEFIQFLRQETRFTSLEKLKAQIAKDCVEAKVLGELYL